MLKLVDLSGEVFYSQNMYLPFLEGFIGSELNTRLSRQVVPKKVHQNENPCEVFQLTSRRFGGPSEPTVTTSPKEQGCEACQKQVSAYGKPKVPKEYALDTFDLL